MNFESIPLFDNHTHPLDPDKTCFTPDDFAAVWLHGFRDLPGGNLSQELVHHVRSQGCVLSAVNQLALKFGCEPTLEAVTRERNKKIEAGGLSAYIEELYRDSKINASLLDSDLPYGDQQLNLFPGLLLRHIQMDPIFFDLIKSKDSYGDMLEAYRGVITKMVKEQGYVSIKSHVGELFTMDIRYVAEQEAEQSFAKAKAGEKQAQKIVYYAVFYQTMLLAQELDIPIHVHSGMTGGFWDGKMDDCDPYRMAPFLRNTPHAMNTKLVLLHSNYPFLSSAALMAHAFPHVWVDLAWVFPWVSLSSAQCIEDLIGIAPISKILIGSGQHNIPEIAWLTGKVARSAIQYVVEKLLAQGMLSQTQGADLASMLLYRNALRLYHITEETFFKSLE